MDLDLKPFFKKYEALVKQADTAFERIRQAHPDGVKCKIKCADCCHALFDLTLIEALYINCQFNSSFKDGQRERLLDRANKADREIYKIKRTAHKDLQAGRDEAAILEEMAMKRVRCPMLNENDQCAIYEFRPITCRLYGLPTSIGGKGHTCGISGFEPGKAYPTVKLDVINMKLNEISRQFVDTINTRYRRMAEMLVPLSMALLTEYTAEYLGITDSEDTACKSKETAAGDTEK